MLSDVSIVVRDLNNHLDIGGEDQFDVSVVVPSSTHYGPLVRHSARAVAFPATSVANTAQRARGSAVCPGTRRCARLSATHAGVPSAMER